MNQHNQYAPGKYYDINSGNITTIDDTIILKHEVIFEELEETTQPDVLGIDAFGRAYRQPAGGGGGGGDVSSTSTDSVVDQLVVWSDATGKTIKKTISTSPTVEKLDTSHQYATLMYRGDGCYFSKKSFGFNELFTDPQFVVPSHSISTSTFDTDTSRIFSINIGCFLNGAQTVISNLTQPTIYSQYFNEGELSFLKRDNCTPNTGYDVNTDMSKIWSISPNVNNIRYDSEIVANGGLVSNVQNNFDNSTTTFLNSTVDFDTATVNNFPPQYNQDLNTDDAVGFNTVTCGSLKVLQLEVNEMSSFIGPQIEIKSTNLRVESTNFTVLPSTNVNFDNALLINLTNSSVDFTGSTVTGLPAGGDVTGPASSVDNGIATYNGTTGKVIQTSNMQIIGTTLNLNGDLDGGIATFNSVNTAALASKTLLPILLNSDISAGTLTLEPSGVLTNSGINDFENSTTNFINSSVNFTGASVLGLPAGGDVTGPLSSTDNAICRYDGATGKIIQNSGITISDTNNLLTSGNVSCFDLTVDNLLNAEDLVAQNTTSQGVNEFSFSSTSFINAVNVDFTGATITNLDRVQFVGTSPVLGQIPYYDDNTGDTINNSGILVNGVNDLTNINNLSCVGINTGQGIAECYAMDQAVLTTSDVIFNSIGGNKIEPQEIVKVGTTTTGTNPNRITLETGGDIPFQLWSRGGSDESFMGFDISNASTNFLSNSNSQVLFEKTGLGLSVYGGNELAGNSFQLTSLNKLLTFGDTNTTFDDAVIFDDSVTTNSSFITMNNVIADNNNISFLTLNGSNQLRTTSLVNTVATLSGSVSFPASGGILTTFPAVDVFVFPITNFTTNLNVQQNCIGDTSGGIIIDAGVPSGICKIMSTCSVKGSNTSNNIYDVSIKRNNVLIDCTVQKISTTDTTLYISTTIQCLSTYDAGDVFQTFFRNKVDTDSLDIESCTFTLHKI
jgi:hypothetical protein